MATSVTFLALALGFSSKHTFGQGVSALAQGLMMGFVKLLFLVRGPPRAQMQEKALMVVMRSSLRAWLDTSRPV